VNLITNIFPHKKYELISENKISSQNDILTWYSENCLAKEAGFVSAQDGIVDLYWIDSKGGRHLTGEIEKGERNTFWTHTFLGHTFEAVDRNTEKLLNTYTIEYDSFFVIGETVSGTDPTYLPNGYNTIRYYIIVLATIDDDVINIIVVVVVVVVVVS
jgi:hypothetical protein